MSFANVADSNACLQGECGVSFGSFLPQENLREDNDTRCHL